MAKRAPVPKLPPPTVRACWAEFLKWVLGVPLVCIGGLAIIGGAVWLTGGQELMWQTTQAMGTSLFYILGIFLMYPLLMFMWVAELRAGLKAARDWDALTPEAQVAAMTAAKAARPAPRSRKKG